MGSLLESLDLEKNYYSFITFAQSPESKVPTPEIFSLLSPSTLHSFEPIRDELCIYLNYLKKVSRWQDHPYQDVILNLNEEDKDNDYKHVLGMLGISRQLEQLGLISLNFDDIQKMILFHDGGEIITSDMASSHPPEMDKYVRKMKDFEPYCFLAYILYLIPHRRETIPIRSEVKTLYSRYENRGNNVLDSEAHAVKLIDVFQGDEFGIQNVYDKSILTRYYPQSIFADSEAIVSQMINKEASCLLKTLAGINDPHDKEKLIDYFFTRQAQFYNNPEFGYQSIYLANNHRVNLE